jgi:hypothetical protein
MRSGRSSKSAYELLTGLPAEEPRIACRQAGSRKSTLRGMRGFDRGLSGFDGFATADDALAALPSGDPVIRETKPQGAMRTLLSKFRWPTKIGG